MAHWEMRSELRPIPSLQQVVEAAIVLGGGELHSHIFCFSVLGFKG